MDFTQAVKFYFVYQKVHYFYQTLNIKNLNFEIYR